MGRHAINLERDARMCTAYVEGQTLQQIGDEHGVTRERVRQILIRSGVERRAPCGVEWTEETHAKVRAHNAFLRQFGLLERHADRNKTIVALREEGLGPREIARRLGVSPGIVSGVLHRKGLTAEPTGRGYGVHASIKRAAVELAGSTTYADAARKYGVSVSSVCHWARRA